MPQRPRSRASRPYLFTVSRGPLRFKFWFRGFRRGVGLPSVWRERVTSVGLGIVPIKEGQMPARPQVASLIVSGAGQGEWGSIFPALSGWLCDAAYPDGEPVGPTQLQLKREGPLLRATLKISDQGGLKCSAVGESPLDAIAALELCLSAEKAPWERDLYPLAAMKSKKK